MIKKIEKDGKLYCLFISANFEGREKYNFLTPNDHYLQIGINSYAAGEKIKNHIHIPCKRELDRTEEIIVLKRGRMLVTVYDEEKTRLDQYEMKSGDTMYLARGGHGFEILEPCEIFEVKQGPYISQTADKEIF